MLQPVEWLFDAGGGMGEMFSWWLAWVLGGGTTTTAKYETIDEFS
jgi:hypothetical protein